MTLMLEKLCARTGTGDSTGGSTGGSDDRLV